MILWAYLSNFTAAQQDTIMTGTEWKELQETEDAHDEYLRECDNTNDTDYLEKWS